MGAAGEPTTLMPAAPPATCPGPAPALESPVLTDAPAAPRLPAPPPEADDRPLPINLATALRLAGARPVDITAAQASVEIAAAELARARVGWLPSVTVGAGYYHHDGATQGQSGNFYINSKDQFLGGGGLVARFAATDALFAPLAARQVLRSQELGVQTARNDALLAVAEAYFHVQQARGRLAGALDVVDKARELGEHFRSLAKGPVNNAELPRARAELAEVEESLAAAREQWRVASADLTLVLRLDPAAVIVPEEPPFLLVTLISPRQRVDDLIPIGLTNRPELASQQALVQAALVRIRQERMRPLVPSLILQGGPGSVGPGDLLMAGVFGSGVSGAGNPWGARDDVSVGLYWTLDNMGLGNRALVRQRQAEQRRVLVDLFRIQDLVAADVARAHAALASGAARSETAAKGLQEAQLSYSRSREELGKLTKVGDVQVLTRRAFEVVDALQALHRAYDNYFVSVNDYNRAQFQLYRALGYPAEALECERPVGPLLPVDTARPSQMAPVCPSDACPCPR
jgi:outer membrane protein TolC